MRKQLAAISISLPVILLILLGRMQSVAHRELSPAECRVNKWDIPVSLQTQPQNISTKNQQVAKLPILIQRPAVTCCQDDSSCLDEVLYQGENSQLPDKKALLTAIDRSLQISANL